ncbi:MAG: sugar phosphate isomerase/epimerase [Planctomycetes bacterium]|nr:sugar phosphate isomerase/epimerase [Planctomycetota bacterium]
MTCFGYNTNGLAHHRLSDAFTLLAELGYGGVALTPDVGELDPLRPAPSLVKALRAQAEDLGLRLAIETGARFVLDPRRKHRPSLLEAAAHERERRVDFYRRSIDLAHGLGASLVSIWSGCAPDPTAADAPGVERDRVEPLWERFVTALVPVLDHARDRDVLIAFEPEPGMFIERPAGYLELVRRLAHRGAELGLTLDVGHLLVTGDLPVRSQIEALALRLMHVHLDDIKDGVHEHRMFGTGDLDLADTLSALRAVDYKGMMAVELSRDSHRGADAAAEAMRHLRRAS